MIWKTIKKLINIVLNAIRGSLKGGSTKSRIILPLGNISVPASVAHTKGRGQKPMTDVHKVNRDINFLTPELKEITIKIEDDLLFHRIPIRRFETIRAIERQKYLVEKKYSKTFHSKHLPNKDGLSQAVDYVVYINKKWSWDYKKYGYYYYMFGALVSKYPRIGWGGLMWCVIDHERILGWQDPPHIQMRG